MPGQRETGEGRQRRYIMIGAPVSTVRTPPLLRAYLATRGWHADVSAVEVAPDELVEFVCRVRADETIDGLLVTMPHKRPLVPLLDGLSNNARLAGSVNAVKRTASGQLVGAQFDGIALLRTLTANGAAMASGRVLIAGLGGAGEAIAHTFAARGCQNLAISDIDPQRAASVLERVRVHAICPVAIAEPDQGSYEVLVNATPLGMRPDDPSPFPDDLVERATWVADIVADPPQTRLAEAVRQAGKRLITGRQMVEGQIEPIGDWLRAPAADQA